MAFKISRGILIRTWALWPALALDWGTYYFALDFQFGPFWLSLVWDR